MFKGTKIERRILEIKHILSDEVRRRGFASGVTIDTFEGRLRNANRPLEEELDTLRTELGFIHQRNTMWGTWIGMAVALIIAFGVPIWQKSTETGDKIDFLYRSIIANEDIHIANSNSRARFESSILIADLPSPYIEYQVPNSLHELLQRKLGIVNYRFLIYYLDQTRELNKIKTVIMDSLVEEGGRSRAYLNSKKLFLQVSQSLDGVGLAVPFNYSEDTECLLSMLQNSFGSIRVDDREEGIRCSSDSLNRKYYHFGFIPIETPEWERPRLVNALMDRGIDISGYFRQ